LSESDQRFFEAAAHLNELRPRILSAAGFPEARLTLERLHLRLPLLSRLGNGAFRLHELFRDFLLERSRQNSELHQALVGRLARALERFGDMDGSIALHMRAQEWDQAIALLTRHGIDRIENGHKAEVVTSLGRFPRKYLDHPVVTGLRGFALAIDGAFAVAKREIEQALKGQIDSQFRGALVMQLATISINSGKPADAVPILRQLMVDELIASNVRLNAAAMLAAACASAGEVELARDAIGFCSSGLNSGAVEIRAQVAHRLSHAHFYLGELGVAEEYATQSVQLAISVGLDSIASRAYAILQNVAAGTYSDMLLVRKYADACTRAAISAGDRTMQIFGQQSQLFVAAFQGDDELYDSSDRALLDMGAERPTQHLMWLRYAKVLREVGRGNVALAISVAKSVDAEKISPSERLFADSIHALLLATRHRDEALRLLSRPTLVAAGKDYESRRLLAYAQVYHALAQWLVGRGRAARRAPTPDLSSVFPRDAALLTVMTTICSTSRQTTTLRQVEQLTEPLLALQMDGQARFLRLLLAPTNTSSLTRTELEVLRELRSGGTTADVADRLGRSSHTVLSHLKSACSKIGCSGRAAAVAYAVDMGWLD
jgi:DNA-binding CsgD family transcriptional regulator